MPTENKTNNSNALRIVDGVTNSQLPPNVTFITTNRTSVNRIKNELISYSPICITGKNTQVTVPSEAQGAYVFLSLASAARVYALVMWLNYENQQ